VKGGVKKAQASQTDLSFQVDQTHVTSNTDIAVFIGFMPVHSVANKLDVI